MKNSFLLFFVAIILGSSCKKFKQNTCQFNECDSRRITKLVAQSWSGKMVYSNQINKWGISTIVVGNPLGKRISYICEPLNDTFKILNKEVTFSGNLKESCNNPKPSFFDEEIYYVQPDFIR